MTGDPAPPQRVWSPGVVHTVLALGGFAIGTTEFATMSLLPAFSKGMGVDAPTGGQVISAYALGVVVGAPLFAVLGAKLSRRNLLVILMGWFALGNALSAFAPSFGALPAALNHSAFNTANALGPWLGGLAITAGYGLTSTGWVGCGLALGGLAILAVALLVERSSKSN